MNCKKKISLRQKQQLKKDISELGYNEHCEIYNIIRKDTDKISENSNGIFINLKYIKDETLNRVEDFVHYCKNNKKMSEEYAPKPNESVTESLIESSLLYHDDLAEGYDSYKKYQQLKMHLADYFDSVSEVTNLKTTSTPSPKVRKYPVLNNKKIKLYGVRERIMKKCRNISRDLYFTDHYSSNGGHSAPKDTDDDMSEVDNLSC